MSEEIKVLKVFIASPGDLDAERKAIREVVDELNKAFEGASSVRLHLLGWEDTMPGCGRPQALINQDLDTADLFVGMIWRRWGTPPGDGSYTSGFEEEIQRALERYSKEGCPEIWLFFKDVDEASRRDPGEDLKRVLAFKEGIIQKRVVLFKEFKETRDWKDLIRGYLLRRLISFQGELAGPIEPTASQAPDHTGESAPLTMPTVEDDIWLKNEARKQVLEICKEVGVAVESGELESSKASARLDRFQVARFGLAAFSLLNRDDEGPLLEAHMINALFRHRENVMVSVIESLLILRSNLANRAANCPGWYWLHKFPINPDVFLPFLSYSDDDANVRRAALKFARKAKVSMTRSKSGETSAIEIVCAHPDAATRKDGLEYLADVGGLEHLPLLKKLLNDENPEVKKQAGRALCTVIANHDANHAFHDYVLQLESVEDWRLEILGKHSNQIEPDLLNNALGNRNRNVRSFAAKELASRALLDAEMIETLDITDSAEVWQAYYLARIKLGERPSTTEVRSKVRSHFYGLLSLIEDRPDPDTVIRALFRELSYEELLQRVDPEIDDGPIAYEILTEKHFSKFSDKLKGDLKEGFASFWKGKANPNPESGSSSGILAAFSLDDSESRKIRFFVAALRGIEEHGGPDDRQVLARYLNDANEQIRIAAMRALVKCGEEKDADLLFGIAQSSTGQIARNAAEIAMKLKPGIGGPVDHFLRSADPLVFELAAKALLGADPDVAWPNMEMRLYDENEKIRKIACAYAVSKFEDSRLVDLLSWYVSPATYYYNVVFHIDRVLYAKPPLNAVFKSEMTSILQ